MVLTKPVGTRLNFNPSKLTFWRVNIFNFIEKQYQQLWRAVYFLDCFE